MKVLCRDRRRVTTLAVASTLVMLLGFAGSASAQLSALYPNFFQIQRPGLLQATLFGGVSGNDIGANLQEGIQLDQSLTPYIGVFGRATGYQLWSKHRGSPFNPPPTSLPRPKFSFKKFRFIFPPRPKSTPRLNYGQFQGGLDFSLYPGTVLYVSGGGNAGDASGSLVEGDFSSWLMRYSRHPINFSFTSLHMFENGVTSSEIDLQTVLTSSEDWMTFGGAGGGIFGGGYLAHVEGQGGVDLGLYYRPWRLGFSGQIGSASYTDVYAQLAVYKQLTFGE